MSKVNNPTELEDNETQFASLPSKHLEYLADWCEYFGLKKWLIPTDNDSNPIRIGKKIHEEMQALPETAETFRLSEFNLENEPIWIAKELLHAQKTTIHSTTNRRIRFKNPNYLHYDERVNTIEKTEERLSFYNKYIAYGTIPPKWIATHFGITTSQLRRFANKHANNLSPQQQQRANQVELGRTAKTLSQWGYKNKDIAITLNVPRTTVHEYIQKVESNWLPPAPPTDKKWFSLFSQE